jgi:hypothetical protein
MPLSSYIVPTSSVVVGKTSFDVRAIAFPDLTSLVQNHMTDLMVIIDKHRETKNDVYAKKNISELVVMVARDFPTLATEIISRCIANEVVTDETRDKIAQLSFPVFIDAMIKIAMLTVEEAGGLKNLIASLRSRLVEATQEMVDQGSLTK